jgi:ring-1,2-phenylacetyl-CoA epoxidase subunit PaaC
LTEAGVGSTEPEAGGTGSAGTSRGNAARAQLLLTLADDELILGWRDSEWTGIAPTLEEDVAFSSIAQNEIGHARALYELAAAELDTDADALAFDRAPDDYRCAPLVELRLLDDWAMTIARRYLYEAADQVRIEALKESDDAELAGLAAKIDREEVYHRLHAELWADRLREEPRFAAAVEQLWPYAVAVVAPEQREKLAAWVGLPADAPDTHERGAHTPDLQPLWEEMTEVRRSVPGAQW